MTFFPPYTPRQYRWFAILWTFGIVLGVSLPADSLTRVQPLLSADKLIHFVLFFGFGTLWMRALYPPPPQRTGRSLWKMVVRMAIFGGLFAGGTEIYQQVIPVRRMMDPYDAIANGAGLAAGLLVYVGFIHLQTGSEGPSSS